jgi:hypothetical protein
VTAWRGGLAVGAGCYRPSDAIWGNLRCGLRVFSEASRRMAAIGYALCPAGSWS